jgi:hypothetical protein
MIRGLGLRVDETRKWACNYAEFGFFVNAFVGRRQFEKIKEVVLRWKFGPI